MGKGCGHRLSRNFAAGVLGMLLIAPALPYAQEGVAGPAQSESPKDASAPPARRQERPDIRVQVTLVTAPVTVINPAGEFVFDLAEKDFRIFDNGIPQRIERFDRMHRPLATVIVIQTNRAVASQLDHIRPLGPVFSDLMLGPEGKAAVVTFDDRVRVLQDFSGDADRLSQTLRAISAQGDQARLNDALGRALAMLGQRPEGERRVIVAFSTGYDDGSETTKEEIVHRATGGEVTLYGLGFNPVRGLWKKKPAAPSPDPSQTSVARPTPPGTVPTPTQVENVYMTPIPGVDILGAAGQVIHSRIASNLLEYYSGYTGGVYYPQGKGSTLQDRLNRIGTEINSQYELAYIPDNLSQSGFHRIEVQVQRPAVKVRTRAGYFYLPGKP